MEMNIVQVRVEDLREAGYNPREMTKKQATDLEESIKKFGLVDPILVNEHEERRNVVIGGHQRLRVARKLGLETVPVHYLNLDPEKEKELNLRLNKNQGQWDKGALASHFEMEMLKDVGFSTNDLNLNIDKFDPQLGDGPEKNDGEEEGEQGELKSHKYTTCPNCGQEFDLN